MKEFFYSAISLLPNIAIIIVIAYFYARKKIPGLILTLIAAIVLTLAQAFNMYAPYYFRDRFSSMSEMQQMYQVIGIISLLAQTLMAIGLGIVLSSYPTTTKNSYNQFS